MKNNIFFHWHDPYFFHKYWIGKINFFRSLTIRDSLDLPIGKKSVCIWFIRIFISFCFTFFFQLKNGWILKQNFVHRIFFSFCSFSPYSGDNRDEQLIIFYLFSNVYYTWNDFQHKSATVTHHQSIWEKLFKWKMKLYLLGFAIGHLATHNPHIGFIVIDKKENFCIFIDTNFWWWWWWEKCEKVMIYIFKGFFEDWMKSKTLKIILFKFSSDLERIKIHFLRIVAVVYLLWSLIDSFHALGIFIFFLPNWKSRQKEHSNSSNIKNRRSWIFFLKLSKNGIFHSTDNLNQWKIDWHHWLVNNSEQQHHKWHNYHHHLLLAIKI